MERVCRQGQARCLKIPFRPARRLALPEELRLPLRKVQSFSSSVKIAKSEGKGLAAAPLVSPTSRRSSNRRRQEAKTSEDSLYRSLNKPSRLERTTESGNSPCLETQRPASQTTLTQRPPPNFQRTVRHSARDACAPSFLFFFECRDLTARGPRPSCSVLVPVLKHPNVCILRKHGINLISLFFPTNHGCGWKMRSTLGTTRRDRTEAVLAGRCATSLSNSECRGSLSY